MKQVKLLNRLVMMVDNTIFKCERCQNVHNEDYKDALGHDYQEYVYDPQTKTHKQVCSHNPEHFKVEKCQFEIIEVVKADCDNGGYTVHKCQTCQGTYNDTPTSPLGHSYGEWVVDRQSTCNREGQKHHSCSRCGKQETDSIAKTSHNIISTDPVAPTCTSEGYTSESRCSVCGTVVTPKKSVPALGHKWGSWQKGANNTHYHVCERDGNHKESKNCQFDSVVTSPTCVDKGYTTHTCPDCHNQYTSDETKALGHDYGDWIAEIVADEKTPGEHNHRHYHTCRRDGAIEYGKCEFTIEEVVEPTCLTGGYTRHVCEKCQAIHEDTLKNATGHQFVYTPIPGNVKWHTGKCSKCNETVGLSECQMKNVEHVDATCDEEGYDVEVCELCQYERKTTTEKLGHIWGDWHYDGDESPIDNESHTHSRVCDRDNTHKQSEPCELVDTEHLPTCVDPGTITRACGKCRMSFTKENAKSLDHKWSKWEPYGNGQHKRVCENNPEHVQIESHNLKTVEIDNGCDKPSQIEYTCYECSYHAIEDSGKAVGHLWGKAVDTNDGFHEKTCLRENCNEKIRESHDYSETNFCKACDHDGLTYKDLGAHYYVEGDNDVLNAKKIIIPAIHNGYEVRGIDQYAFRNNSNVTEVEIPYTVIDIGKNSFDNCSSLLSITFNLEQPSCLKTIHEFAFNNCTELNNVVLPNGLEEIKSYAFYVCRKLSKITVPDTVTKIGEQVFSRAAIMENFDNGGEAFYIGTHLIRVSPNQAGEFTVNAGTVSISSEAFLNCSYIEKVILPDSLKEIDFDAFKGCTGLNSVEFEGTIDEWFAITFENDYSSPLFYANEFHIDDVSGIVSIPNGVKSIPAGTFRNTNIESIDIPSSVTSIGAEAFKDCAKLKQITIADSVLYIGDDAFTNCEFYNNDDNWVNGFLYIGNYLIAAKEDKLQLEEEGTIKVNPGTIIIGQNVFEGFSSIKKVIIPTSVLVIQAKAFENMASLAEVVFEDSTSSWFASTSIGMGRLLRGDTISNPRNAAYSFKLYNAIWQKNNIINKAL